MAADSRFALLIAFGRPRPARQQPRRAPGRWNSERIAPVNPTRPAPLSMFQVLLCGAAIVTLSMGIRHGFDLWLQPITMDRGWSRETFAHPSFRLLVVGYFSGHSPLRRRPRWH
jgi:hypothetical protein